MGDVSEAGGWAIRLWHQPQVLHGGRPVSTGSRKALALLLLLILQGPQTRERLALWLWPDADAAAARRNLRRDLFRLREAGIAMSETDDGALTLVERFAVDVGEAPAALLGGLDDVAGEEFDSWLGRQRIDLEGRRARAQRLRAQERAAAGDSEGAHALLRGLLQANPGDDAAALEAAALLRGLGRGDEALAVLRQAEAALSELALQPTPALRQALGQRHDAPPAASAPAPAELQGQAAGPRGAVRLPARAPFVPRLRVQRAVQQAWARGLRVYLAGAPGMGKSRLAQELAAGQGAWVRLACEPNDALVPFASAVRALRTLREAAPDVELPPWVLRELAQLLPELGPAPASRDTDEARARLVAAHAAAFAALLADNFQALVVDDWHWVDDGSLELWAQVEPPRGVVVLLAHRMAQLSPAALQRQHAEVDAGRAVRLVLEGLDEAQALELVRSLSGSPGGALFARRLQQATAGNPFFLLETLRQLLEQGLLLADADGGWRTPFDDQTRDYAELPVPPTVREAVLSRVRMLGEPAQRLLEAASLAGERFDLALLRGIAGGSDEAMLALLAHAVAAQLVVAQGSGWSFAHDLVRQCLADGLGGARRRVLHQRLAVNLAASGAAPALLAHHHEAAGDLASARSAYRAAAESARRLHAPEQALGWWRDVLRCGAQGAEAVRAHLAMVEFHRQRVDRAAADAALDAASEAARAADLESRVAVQLVRAKPLAVEQGAQALHLLDPLLPLLPHLPLEQRLQVLELRGRALMFLDRTTEAIAALQQAIAMGEQAGGGLTTALMLDSLARTHLRQGRMQESADAASRAVAMLELLDEPSALSDSLNALGVAWVHMGRIPEVRPVLQRARDLARSCGHVPAQRGAIFNLVKLATDAGRTDEAVRLLDEAEALAPTFEHVRAEQAFREARYYVHYLRGEQAAADQAARALIESAARVGGFNERIGARILVIDLYLLAGDLQTAGALIDQSDELEQALLRQAEGSEFATQLRAKRAWWHLERGEPSQAEALLAPLEHCAPESMREEDGLIRAWIGSAAARRLGEARLAADRLRQVDGLRDGVPTDHQAPWLIEALALGSDSGLPLERVRLRAQELLATRLAPAQWLQRLEAALG